MFDIFLPNWCIVNKENVIICGMMVCGSRHRLWYRACLQDKTYARGNVAQYCWIQGYQIDWAQKISIVQISFTNPRFSRIFLTIVQYVMPDGCGMMRFDVGFNFYFFAEVQPPRVWTRILTVFGFQNISEWRSCSILLQLLHSIHNPSMHWKWVSWRSTKKEIYLDFRFATNVSLRTFIRGYWSE